MPLDDEQYATALLKEYERVATEIRTIETANEKIIGLGVAVITAGFAYGVAQTRDEVLFLILMAFSGIFLFAILQYHNLLWFGGYKRVIEDRINAVFGRNTIGWEAVVRGRPRVHIINGSLVGVYIAVSTTATVYCLIRILAHYSAWISILYTGLTICLLVLVLLSLRRMGQAFEEAERAARLWMECGKPRPAP